MSGVQCLDPGVGKDGLVDVLRNTGRTIAGHDLRDEPLLIIHQLIEVAAKGPLGDAAENLDFRFSVALTDDAVQELGQVGGPPNAINVMECY